MKIKIVDNNEKYYNELYIIHNNVMPEQDKMTKNNFYDEFNRDTRKYFVAINEYNKVVGYVGVLDTNTDYNIMGIAVKKECFRQGVATKLIRHLKDTAKDNNVLTISLEVDETNIPAINFYKKMGFVLTNIRKKYYKNNDALIMWYYL